MNNEKLKFKPISIDRLIISFDRLTRFKNPEDKYLRVFKDIITQNLICPKYKKTELDAMEYSVLTDLACNIINSSLPDIKTDYSINNKILDYETKTFKMNNISMVLLKNNINYDALISVLPENLPSNLKWLKYVSDVNYTDINSHKFGYHFPIKKVVLCEGITEEILLPEFADLLNFDFSKNGVQLISAGGKNQVVKLFYKFAEELKIPLFVLLDNDAEQNSKEIEPKLRKGDKIYRIKSGEFEDIIPKSLIEKSLKFSVENISDTPEESEEDFSEGTVHYLEEFYRTRGAHEFKKAEFAQTIKANISDISDVSDELINIIHSIKTL